MLFTISESDDLNICDLFWFHLALSSFINRLFFLLLNEIFIINHSNMQYLSFVEMEYDSYRL